MNSDTNAVFRCIEINSTSDTLTCDYNLFYNTDASVSLIAWEGTSYTQAQ
jgi:hypothetical protein